MVLSWLCQLAERGAVQFVLIDGKGGGDYSAWAHRAWMYAGDELDGATAVLERVHTLMRARLAVLEAQGPRNRWHVGPTPDWPLIVTVIDECQSALDLDAVKGDRNAEAHVRSCRRSVASLVRKGRSPLFLTVLVTQKPTSDSLPTSIRDNCRVALSFAVKTKDAAVATLGEQIREYPSACPTTLQDEAYIAVATAALRTGHDPFVRLRVPQLTEEAADARAIATASLRLDPTRPPQPLPENAPQRALRAV
jgi:S-DNA-T family DNA segregation ATPase FtsK/SpoIIIE